MRRGAAPLAALALCVALAGCGLQPMYSGGGDGAVAQGLAAIEVAPIEGRAGWLVRNALRDRLAQSGEAGAPRYRLDVLLDDDLEGFGLLTDETVGRERRTLRARCQGMIAPSRAGQCQAQIGSSYSCAPTRQQALALARPTASWSSLPSLRQVLNTTSPGCR